MPDEMVSGVQPLCRLGVVIFLYNSEGIVAVYEDRDRKISFLADTYLHYHFIKPHSLADCSI
jgi:hypothetical protein